VDEVAVWKGRKRGGRRGPSMLEPRVRIETSSFHPWKHSKRPFHPRHSLRLVLETFHVESIPSNGQ